MPGPYRILPTATAPDGSIVGDREAGWAAQPAADEFARLKPDREFLKRSPPSPTAKSSTASNFPHSSPASYPATRPITEPWTSPLWHNPLYFLVAIACLAAEWGLRRVNGLA